MTPQTMQDARNPNSARAERMQDVLMLSSFGFWAVLLGLVPVLAFHTLMGG
jgi:hypothetical protein